MQCNSIRKKTATILLLISLLSGILQRPSDTTNGTLTIQRMGVTLNSTGPSDKVFQGSTLNLLSNSAGRQMLSMVMKAADGSLIVIDGGWAMDASQLTKVLQDNGGRVSAWFLTHPHDDHVGAFIDIVNTPNSPIAIDNVYYALAEQSWYDTREPSRSGTVQQLRDALSKFPAEKLHNMMGKNEKGQKIQIGAVTAEFMNNIYLLEETSVNNSSMVIKFVIDGVSIMVLGDLGPEGGSRLLAESTPEELKSDIVQMAHHGQYGVEKDVYAAINPRICLWPTPRWLWNNDVGKGVNTGPWLTLETRRWMDELGVDVHYGSKDGDWLIR